MRNKTKKNKTTTPTFHGAVKLSSRTNAVETYWNLRSTRDKLYKQGITWNER